MTELGKWAVSFALICALGGLCYVLGRAHAEVRIVSEKVRDKTEEIEVIKNVVQQKEKIWSKPHADRDTLLKLMREGKL